MAGSAFPEFVPSGGVGTSLEHQDPADLITAILHDGRLKPIWLPFRAEGGLKNVGHRWIGVVLSTDALHHV